MEQVKRERLLRQTMGGGGEDQPLVIESHWLGGGEDQPLVIEVTLVWELEEKKQSSVLQNTVEHLKDCALLVPPCVKI